MIMMKLLATKQRGHLCLPLLLYDDVIYFAVLSTNLCRMAAA